MSHHSQDPSGWEMGVPAGKGPGRDTSSPHRRCTRLCCPASSHARNMCWSVREGRDGVWFCLLLCLWSLVYNKL